MGNWIEAVNCAGISFNSGGHDGHSGYPLTDALVKENTIIRPALNERPDAYRPVAWKAGIRVEGEVEGAEITANRIFGSEHNGILISPGPAGDLLIEGNEIQRFKDSGISVPQGSAVDNLTIKDNEIIGSRPLEIEADGAVLEGNIFKTYPSGDDSDYQDVYKCYRFEYETGWRQKPQEAGRGALEINVRSCGAKGDGRNNDLPAFCAALAQIPQEGGTVYIPEGTYYLAPLADKETFPFTIIRQHLLVANRAKIALRGEGEQTVLLFASQFHQGIRLVNVQNAVLKDLTLQLSRQPQVRTNRALLDLSACGKVTVRNVTCKDSAGPAIQVDASTGIVIEDCRITNAGTHGIRLCASRQVWLQNNAIADSRDNGIFISYYGSISREAQYIEVSGNTIAGTKEGFGISLTSGNHVEITNNIIRQTYQAGIAIYPLAFFFPKSVRIQANELRECNLGALSYTEGAISLYSLPRGAIECSGNSISQTGTGIWVSGCLLNDLIMEANDFQACEVASDLSQEQREQILDQRVSPPALRNDGPKIVVSDAEISGGKYVYQLTFAEMTAAPGNKFATDLSESENIKLVSTPRERYVIPVPGTSGYFLYVFDFSQASYRPVHLVLRDGFYSILDGSIAQSFISTDGLDWTAMNQHLAPGKSTLSFCTQEEGLLVRGQMPERVYYLVTFNATQSEFQGSQTQWNRLLEGDNDRDKCFRLEFDVERIAP